MDPLTAAFLNAPLYVTKILNAVDFTESFDLRRANCENKTYKIVQGDCNVYVHKDVALFLRELKIILDSEGPKGVVEAIKRICQIEWNTDKRRINLSFVFQAFSSEKVKEYTKYILRSFLLNGVDPNEPLDQDRSTLTERLLSTKDRELVNIAIEFGGVIDIENMRYKYRYMTREKFEFAKSFEFPTQKESF